MIFSISLESDIIFCDEEWSFSLPTGLGILKLVSLRPFTIFTLMKCLLWHFKYFSSTPPFVFVAETMAMTMTTVKLWLAS